VNGSQHRSYSQLNQVRTCGESYRLARIEGLPERPNVPAVMGRVFHTVSEHIDKLICAGEGSSVGQLVDATVGVVAETLAGETNAAIDGYGPVETWLHYGNQDYAQWQAEILPRTVRNYIEWRLSRTDLSLLELPDFGPAIEVPVEYTTGDLLVRGYVDRIFVGLNGVPLVLDFKTGKKPETVEQLATYRLALRQQYGRDFRWGAYLYGINGGTSSRGGKPVFAGPYDLDCLSEDSTSRTYLEADRAIKHGIFIPHPQDFCFHCGVQEHCTFAQARA
jgi:hypothetical protein